jgi:hypothetical protein
MCEKSRGKDCYSVVAITLGYILALSHNASKLEESYRFPFYSYCSRLLETIIASYGFCSRLTGNVIAFQSYGSDNITKAITCNAERLEVTLATSA